MALVLLVLINVYSKMILGIIISQVGGAIYMKDVPISIWSVVISMTVAVVVGIASGLTPALKASCMGFSQSNAGKSEE